MRLPSCTNMTCTPTCDDEKQAAARLFPPLFLHAFIEWHQLKQLHSKHLMARWITQLGSAHAQQERGRSTLAGKKEKRWPASSHLETRAHAREKGGRLTCGSWSSAPVQSTSSLTEDSHASSLWAADPASQGKVRSATQPSGGWTSPTTNCRAAPVRLMGQEN